jgi:CBS domain-containing protein
VTKAREIMTPGVEFARRDETIENAARRMLDRDVGALPVCNADRQIDGVVTDRDITVRVVALGLDPATTTVGEVVGQREVVTVGADDPVERARQTMKDHAVRRVPVVDGDRVVGIISQGDIATNVPESKTGDLVESISEAP